MENALVSGFVEACGNDIEMKNVVVVGSCSIEADESRKIIDHKSLHVSHISIFNLCSLNFGLQCLLWSSSDLNKPSRIIWFQGEREDLKVREMSLYFVKESLIL